MPGLALALFMRGFQLVAAPVVGVEGGDAVAGLAADVVEEAAGVDGRAGDGER